MKKTESELIGICGLYCKTCPRYLAYQDQDVEEFKKMSEDMRSPSKKSVAKGL